MNGKSEQSIRTPRRTFLSAIGLGGLAALIASIGRSQPVLASEDEMTVNRVAAYYNTTSDWMAWVQVMNENASTHQISIHVYNLAGDHIYENSLTLNPFQTQILPLEADATIKGKQGMVVLSSDEDKSLAAFIISRKASEPDYTASVTPFCITSMSS